MKDYLIIGTGGIGTALCNYLTGLDLQVDLAGRQPVDCPYDAFIQFDYADEHDCHRLANYINDQGVKYVINTTGILHDSTNMPEKSISYVSTDWFLQSMHVNCLSSLLLLKHLNQILDKNHPLAYIALSARVGSIDDNHLGGWISYRASKAALNMVIKTAAIEWRRTHKHAIIVGYHPGTVDTNLSKPFNSRVKRLFAPEQAADYLYQFSQGLRTEMSGCLYDWQQKQIPF